MNTTRQLSRLSGYACVGIGTMIAVFGTRVEPDAEDASATVDSLLRFYGTIFAGYGYEWLRAAKSSTPNSDAERLAAVMALGGVARLISAADKGKPHPLHAALTAVEFAFPAAVFVSTRLVGKDSQ